MDADLRLKELLRDTDLPCPGCGYNLRGYSDNACPECGERLSLRRLLSRRPQAMGSWVAMLVCTAAGLPQSSENWRQALGGTLHYSGEFFQFSDFTGAMPWYGFLSQGYWLAQLPLLVALLVFRDTWRSLPRGLQWWLAAAAIALSVVAQRRVALGVW